jgi:prepilin-type processing-associated H-X9-DG protein/prepilin-type N-terminal cleavage/methylation domain-containing protein
MKNSAFTLLEMLVVLSIAATLIALSAAGWRSAIEQAHSVTCLNNLRQWGVAMQCYVNDNDGYLPRRGQGVQQFWIYNRPTDWFNALPPYIGAPTLMDLVAARQLPQPGQKNLFVCPSAERSNTATYFLCYGMNMYLSRWDQNLPTRVLQLPNRDTIAFMADSPGGYASTMPSSAGYSVQARHNGNAHVAFLDGHVQSFPGDYIGCGTGEKDQPDIRWPTEMDGDTWHPN